jgi:23S rRNA A1618 N6-methylase RlmF
MEHPNIDIADAQQRNDAKLSRGPFTENNDDHENNEQEQWQYNGGRESMDDDGGGLVEEEEEEEEEEEVEEDGKRQKWRNSTPSASMPVPVPVSVSVPVSVYVSGSGSGSGSGRGMHERNKYYNRPPDFAALAIKYPAFANVCIPRQQLQQQQQQQQQQQRSNNSNNKPQLTINWKDDHAVRYVCMYVCELGREGEIDGPMANTRILNETLLKEDYGIHIELPSDHLCPTVSTRVNYIHWIEDLLAQSSKHQPHQQGKVGERSGGDSVIGLDIGCGASCIYPLLGIALHPHGEWAFVASEVDTDSIIHANHNISLNGWEKYIQVYHQPDPSQVLLRIPDKNEKEEELDRPYPVWYGANVSGGSGDGSSGRQNYDELDFCMFNPPFFTTVEEKAERRTTTCPATTTELAFSGGGEIQLLQQMLQDSILLGDRIRWYTSMIGRKVTLKKILAMLRRAQVPTIRTTEFCQGRTTRWFIAWSWFQIVDQHQYHHRRQHQQQPQPQPQPQPQHCTSNQATMSASAPKRAKLVEQTDDTQPLHHQTFVLGMNANNNYNATMGPQSHTGNLDQSSIATSTTTTATVATTVTYTRREFKYMCQWQSNYAALLLKLRSALTAAATSGSGTVRGPMRLDITTTATGLSGRAFITTTPATVALATATGPTSAFCFVVECFVLRAGNNQTKGGAASTATQYCISMKWLPSKMKSSTTLSDPVQIHEFGLLVTSFHHQYERALGLSKALS